MFELRVTPPARPVPALAPNGPNIAKKWLQHGAKNLPKWRRSDGVPPPPPGVKMPEKMKNNIDPTKKRVDFTALALLSRKGGQHGPNLGPKMQARWIKNLTTKFVLKSTPRSIKKTIDFCIGLLSIFDRFWRPTWSQVGHIFLQNGGTLWSAAPFFVGCMLAFGFCSPFWAHGPMGYHSPGAHGPMGYPPWGPRSHGVPPPQLDFGWFLGSVFFPFWCQVGPMLGPLGPGS